MAESIRDEIRADRKLRQRGEWPGSDLDEHDMLSRLKVAAALRVLHAAQARHPLLDALPPADRSQLHYRVDEEDWELAGVIMAKSAQTRALLEHEAREKVRRVNAERGQMEADRAVMVRDAEERRELESASRAIQRRLAREREHGPGWIAGSEAALELAAGLPDGRVVVRGDEFGTFMPPVGDPPRFDPWGHTMRRPHNRAHTLGPVAGELYGHGYQPSAYSQAALGGAESGREEPGPVVPPARGTGSGGRPGRRRGRYGRSTVRYSGRRQAVRKPSQEHPGIDGSDSFGNAPDTGGPDGGSAET